MDENRINLTQDAIYKKDFKVDAKGYRIKEVDEFLDKIIEDYGEFFKIFKEKEAEKTALFDEIISLKQENRDMRMKLELHEEEKKEEPKEINNLDLMKRLARLEKAVYGIEKDNN